MNNELEIETIFLFLVKNPSFSTLKVSLPLTTLVNVSALLESASASAVFTITVTVSTGSVPSVAVALISEILSYSESSWPVDISIFFIMFNLIN